MRKFFTIAASLVIATTALAQEEGANTLAEQNATKIAELEKKLGVIKGLKISGYIQGQWQWAEQPGIAAFGDGGSFSPSTNNRFMLRRGRIKFAYNIGVMEAVIQPDFTEKGVGIKDAYLGIKAKSKVAGLKVGIFDRPFGYEISYSSSLRESPERSRVFLSLFPNERDLGAAVSLTGPVGSWLNNFTLDAGLFNGNGIGGETDSRKDFIGRLAYLKSFDNIRFGLSASFYDGGVYQFSNDHYSFNKNTKSFDKSEGVEGKYTKRRYTGFGATFLADWDAGTTNLRAEYVFGRQPGTAKANSQPGGGKTISGDASAPMAIYSRDFSGYYAILVQDIGRTKHSVVLKYDYYDPNTQIKGNEIGVKNSNTSAVDMAYSTFGVGYLFRWNENIRLMAYYDMVANEKSANLASIDPVKDFARNVKDNVLTIRFQVKF